MLSHNSLIETVCTPVLITSNRKTPSFTPDLNNIWFVQAYSRVHLVSMWGRISQETVLSAAQLLVGSCLGDILEVPTSIVSNLCWEVETGYLQYSMQRICKTYLVNTKVHQFQATVGILNWDLITTSGFLHVCILSWDVNSINDKWQSCAYVCDGMQRLWVSPNMLVASKKQQKSVIRTNAMPIDSSELCVQIPCTIGPATFPVSNTKPSFSRDQPCQRFLKKEQD